MKLSVMTCFVFLFTFAISSAQSFTMNNFNKLQWMIGNWKMPTKHGSLQEQWQKLNDSTLQSKGFIVKTNADTILLETVQIRFSKNKLYYVPTVNGQNSNEPVAFIFQAVTSKSFTAVNAAHDFPQRIYYSSTGKNTLYAEVWGKEKGKSRKEVFSYTRNK